MPLSAVLRVMGSNPTWDNTMLDPQIVVLSLSDHCVRFIYIYKVPRGTIYF